MITKNRKRRRQRSKIKSIKNKLGLSLQEATELYFQRRPKTLTRKEQRNVQPI